MKETVIVTAIGSFSAQNVISACHAAGMRVVGCDIYPAEWVVNSQDVEVFYIYGSFSIRRILGSSDTSRNNSGAIMFS